jgi:di/tricarboxylate transporter
VLGGSCTLIGTSTNLLVNDMASVAGQARFGIFEITPVGVSVALAGGLYLLLFSRVLTQGEADAGKAPSDTEMAGPGLAGGQIGSAAAFAPRKSFKPFGAIASLLVFVGVIATAAWGLAPIAATAFAGAVLLILMRVITADEAYQGLRADVLMLIAGMVVLGVALEVTGLAQAATDLLIRSLDGVSPLLALIILYGATLFATEILSNATVAVLFTPIAVSFADALGVSPRPFLVAVMIAGSAAFATPFGYQTNVIVYRMGGYNYMDFMRLGIPLNLVTWAVAVLAIRATFPF